MFDVFPSIQAEILEVIALTADSVVLRNRLTGRARASGMEIDQSWIHAGKSRDGKTVWWGFYDTSVEGLEAVGLSTSAAGRANARPRS